MGMVGQVAVLLSGKAPAEFSLMRVWLAVSKTVDTPWLKCRTALYIAQNLLYTTYGHLFPQIL